MDITKTLPIWYYNEEKVVKTKTSVLSENHDQNEMEKQRVIDFIDCLAH